MKLTFKRVINFCIYGLLVFPVFNLLWFMIRQIWISETLSSSNINFRTAFNSANTLYTGYAFTGLNPFYSIIDNALNASVLLRFLSPSFASSNSDYVSQFLGSYLIWIVTIIVFALVVKFLTCVLIWAIQLFDRDIFANKVGR